VVVVPACPLLKGKYVYIREPNDEVPPKSPIFPVELILVWPRPPAPPAPTVMVSVAERAEATK
jgi:hypothetical protein